MERASSRSLWGSGLEGWGAIYLAPLVAPFMPFIILAEWWKHRAEVSGKSPAAIAETRYLVIGAICLMVLGAAVILPFVV